MRKLHFLFEFVEDVVLLVATEKVDDVGEVVGVDRVLSDSDRALQVEDRMPPHVRDEDQLTRSMNALDRTTISRQVTAGLVVREEPLCHRQGRRHILVLVAGVDARRNDIRWEHDPFLGPTEEPIPG